MNILLKTTKIKVSRQSYQQLAIWMEVRWVYQDMIQQEVHQLSNM